MKNKEIHWIFPQTWLSEILTLLNQVNKPNLYKLIDESESTFELLEDIDFQNAMNSFWKNYHFIRLYHATKPIDVKNIFKQGLLPMKTDIQFKVFHDLFINDTFKVTKKELEESFKRIGLETRENHLHVVLDYRHMIERAGHYLIYGSEFILGLVVNLPKFRHDLIQVLLKKGIPTIYHISFPIELLSDYDKATIFKEFLYEYLDYLGRDSHFSTYIDYTLTLKESILPNYIVDHFHPNNIINHHYPHYGPQIFHNNNKCELCTDDI